MSKPNGYNEEFRLEICEGRYYRTREGKVVGPLKRPPVIFSDLARDANKPPIWYWCASRVGEDNLYWTIDGRWYEKRDKPSPNDLAQELSSEAALLQEKVKVYEEAKEKAVLRAAPVPMTKRALLEAAIAATADRGLNYGKPEDNFARIAAHWSAYLANRVPSTSGPSHISATDVAIMCALLKIARLENDPRHQDSWVDLAGYAACGAEIALKGTDSSTGTTTKPLAQNIDPTWKGWHEWAGGEMPVEGATKVYYKMRGHADKEYGPDHADLLRWNASGSRHDIIAWRFV